MLSINVHGESTIMLRILATYGVHELCELQPVLMKLRSAPSCIEYDTYYMSKGPMKIKPISATVIDSVWKDVYEGADFLRRVTQIRCTGLIFCICKKIQCSFCRYIKQ